MTREERAREAYAQAVERLGGPARISIAAYIRADTSSKYYHVTIAAMLAFADAEAAAMRERAELDRGRAIKWANQSVSMLQEAFFPVADALRALEAYLSHTPHHNAPEAAAARKALRAFDAADVRPSLNTSDVRIILQAVADADSEDCIGSIDVDIPKGGYPRQWLREAARTALQSLGGDNANRT